MVVMPLMSGVRDKTRERGEHGQAPSKAGRVIPSALGPFCPARGFSSSSKSPWLHHHMGTHDKGNCVSYEIHRHSCNHQDGMSVVVVIVACGGEDVTSMQQK